MHIGLPFCFFVIFSKPSFIIIIISLPPPTRRVAAVNCVHKEEENGRKIQVHTHGAGTKGEPFSHAADRV